MMDLGRACLLVALFVAAVRARYVAGVVAAVLCGGVFATEMFLVVRFPLRIASVDIAMGAAFLGPSAIPHDPPFAWTAAFTDPIHHLAATAIAALAAAGAFAEGRPLRPETERARRLDRAGLRFVAVAVIHGLMSVSGLLARVVLAPL